MFCRIKNVWENRWIESKVKVKESEQNQHKVSLPCSDGKKIHPKQWIWWISYYNHNDLLKKAENCFF